MFLYSCDQNCGDGNKRLVQGYPFNFMVEGIPECEKNKITNNDLLTGNGNASHFG